MNIKILHILAAAALVAGLTSCNKFLDKVPEGEVTPPVFFRSADDLAAYTIKYYNFTSVNPGSYGLGPWALDNGTDNQAAVNYTAFWVPGEWKVSDGTGGWDFSQVRHCNYFFEQVLPRFEAGEISGNGSHVKHYIGEMYVIRAYNYFNLLKNFGDLPIITDALPDEVGVLMESSKRMPQNKVARFILQDLDKAAELLQDKAPGGKNRIGKDVAYLLHSRVALYEGTWLKHHKGTAFVPGGPGWPGSAEDVKGFDIDSEIDFFLSEAMRSSKIVADKLVDNLVVNTDTPEGYDATQTSINPYFSMFSDENMENYSEVLMWRAYSKSKGIAHNIQRQLISNGGGSGWTRGLVNSFVMRNGLPIYASGSGYDANWEKEGIKSTLKDRDSRIQIFTKKDNDVETYSEGKPASIFDPTWIVKGNSETRMTTGYAIKKGKIYLPLPAEHHSDVSGSIIFRGTEALLNYMEASYEKTGTIDSNSDRYWRALRKRAKVNPDYNATINATDMSIEARFDFGAYSHGKLIDPTLYNIRRERRNELIGEGMRWADLKRWRACDQINGYQIEGMRYWGSIYEGNLKNDKGEDLVVVDPAGGKGNMSDPAISGVYIRPYQISRKNNSVFEGYRFTPAHYLAPIGQKAFRNTTPEGSSDLATSVIYQNPGWPRTAGQGPKEVK